MSKNIGAIWQLGIVGIVGAIDMTVYKGMNSKNSVVDGIYGQDDV